MTYDVYHIKSGAVIGYTNSPKGGLINHPNGYDLVGRILSQESVLFIIADQAHHTGQRYTGDEVQIDNKPSKRY